MNILSYVEKQSLDTKCVISHKGDVAQGWKVDKWRKIQFSAFPAWIRRSFFGRSTWWLVYIRLRGFGDPHEVLDKWIDNPQQPIPEWTMEIPEIERRLVSEYRTDTNSSIWLLLYFSLRNRTVCGVMSEVAAMEGWTAWVRVLMANPAPLSSASGMAAIQKFRGVGIRSTTLLPCWKTPPEGMTLSYGIDARSAELVKKHARRLPWALAMRIGE